MTEENMITEGAFAETAEAPIQTAMNYALNYATKGWRVIPLHTPDTQGKCSCRKDCGSSGKHPRTMNGLKDATTDEAKIRHWWGMWSDANIGIVTGAESGIIVLDVDPRHGGDESLTELQHGHAWLPETCESSTGGGGNHIIFAHPGGTIRNSAGKLGDGLDIRGDGGFIVAPPSLHASGRHYEWMQQEPLAAMPEWVLNLLTAAPQRQAATSLITGEEQRITEGKRNSYLASLAGTMRRRGMSGDAILAALLVTNERECDPQLSVEEVESIARSISRYAPQGNTLDVLTRAPQTDAGNAECMVTLFGDAMRYDYNRKKWLTWDGVRWRVDGIGQAYKAAVEMARIRQQAALELEDNQSRSRNVNWGLTSENIFRVKATLELSQCLPAFRSTIEQYDANPLLATAHNGTLDLHEGDFRESDPNDFLTMQLGTEFLPHVKAPRWEQFLQEVFNCDQELIAFIQRAVGYSLTGDTSEQVFFLCYGNGANGKSVFLDTIAKLLGDYAGAGSFNTFDAERRNEATNDLAALKGKRFVTVIETEEDKRLAEAKIKSVTGQDAITCRFLYCEYFTYRPEFKIWMAMNHLPIIRGGDRGIWRRIRVIPFLQSFEGREDRSLPAKLQAELPGILNWALQGLKDWREQGLGTLPDSMKKATEEYRRDNDSIGRWLEERTKPNPFGLMRAAHGYQNYSDWMKDGGEMPFSQKNWGRSLRERGYEKSRNQAGYYYLGLELVA